MLKKLYRHLTRKKLLLFVELDKEKFKKGAKGSCEVWNVFPKIMPEEEKQKAKQFIMDYIDLVRKYL